MGPQTLPNCPGSFAPPVSRDADHVLDVLIRSVFHDGVFDGSSTPADTPLKADPLAVKQGALSGAQRPRAATFLKEHGARALMGALILTFLFMAYRLVMMAFR
jgi:hypothetical protein